MGFLASEPRDSEIFGAEDSGFDLISNLFFEIRSKAEKRPEGRTYRSNIHVGFSKRTKSGWSTRSSKI